MPDTIPAAVPAAVNPIADLGQIDYRADPSSGTNPQGHPTGSYDHPIPADAHAVQPWTDQTWAAYDEQTDATRYRGINSPEQQAQLHLSPDPDEDAHGWAPDLEKQLAWERQVDGSPPMYRGGP